MDKFINSWKRQRLDTHNEKNVFENNDGSRVSSMLRIICDKASKKLAVNCTVENVAMDGNCLFSSMASQLGRTGSNASLAVRTEVMDYLDSHREIIFDVMSKQAQDNYIRGMRKNGTFGEGIALSAAARCYNRPIIIFSPEAVQHVDLPPARDDDGKRPAMYLGLFSEHYVSIKTDTKFCEDDIIKDKANDSNEHDACGSAHVNMNNQSDAMTDDDMINSDNDEEDEGKNGDKNNDETEIWPSVCNRDQFLRWKNLKSWLVAKSINDKEIGVSCRVCQEVGSVSRCRSSQIERLSVSPEWLAGVTAKNSKKLNDKVTAHEQSKSHAACVKELKMRAKKQIENSAQRADKIWRNQNDKRVTETNKIFRTVYVIAWKHLSFRTLPHLRVLQQQNGISMGNMLFSHQTCSNIINFMAAEMRKKLVQFIVESGAPFSLMMDESTTVSKKTTLIVYIRMLDPTGIACNSFLTLSELESGTTGVSIADTLKLTLNEMGLSDEILRSRLIGFCTDGASNLQGCVQGALKLFGDKLKKHDLVIFHCMNHKLELAVHAAVTHTNVISRLRMFMDTLYSFYSRSPRNCRLLESASTTLGTEIKRIGKIFDVRWLSSSFRSVDALLTSLPAVVEHLQQASGDSSQPAKERAKATGMVNKLKSWAFLSEVALLRDVLEILKNLSLYMESRSASILEMKSRLDTTFQMLTSFKTVDGLSLSAFNNEVDATGSYCGFRVSRTKADATSFDVMRRQFLQAVVDNMTVRFPDQQLLAAGAVLSPSTWPSDEDQLAVYGDSDVIKLARLLQVDTVQAVDQFRIFKNNRCKVGRVLSNLMQRVELLPLSSAECERGFSLMNLNADPVRNQLSIQTLSSLIFIKVNGPTPVDYKPDYYVQQWLSTGHHSSSDRATGKKSEKQKRVSPMAFLF